MVDAVGTITTQSSVQRYSAPAVSATTQVGAASESTQREFVSSSIVVDNLQNVVIMEYRSSQGELVDQFPTKLQIEAFKRAQEASSAADEQRAERAALNGSDDAQKVVA